MDDGFCFHQISRRIFYPHLDIWRQLVLPGRLAERNTTMLSYIRIWDDDCPNSNHAQRKYKFSAPLAWRAFVPLPKPDSLPVLAKILSRRN